jgi:hypothetical protein
MHALAAVEPKSEGKGLRDLIGDGRMELPIVGHAADGIAQRRTEQEQQPCSGCAALMTAVSD